MRFSVFYLPSVGRREDVIAKKQPGRNTEAYQQMLQHVVEQAKLIEEMGFYSIVFSEHHFETEGLEVSPNPLMMALYVGMQTQSIRVGTMGCQLPGWNPIRLAEEVSMVDQMLRGRLDVGIVRGQEWPREVVNVGQRYGMQVAAPKTDEDASNREIMNEHYEVFKTLMTNDLVKIKTKHWEIPLEGSAMPDIPVAKWVDGVTTHVGGNGDLGDVPPEQAPKTAWGYPMRKIEQVGLVPAPYQRPTPPLHIPFVSSPDTVKWAGREGIRMVFMEPDPEKFIALRTMYVEAAESVGRKPNVDTDICNAFWFHTGDDAKKVREETENGIFWFNDSYIAAIRGNLLGGKRVTYEDFVSTMGQGMAVGTPDEVYDNLNRYVEATGLNHVFILLGADLLMSNETIKRSVELFSTKVMSRFGAESAPSVS